LGWRMFQRGNAEAIEFSKTKKTSPSVFQH